MMASDAQEMQYPIVVGGGDTPPASPRQKRRAKELIILIKTVSDLEKSLWKKLDRLSEMYELQAMDKFGEFADTEPSHLYFDFIINSKTREVLSAVDELVEEIFAHDRNEFS